MGLGAGLGLGSAGAGASPQLARSQSEPVGLTGGAAEGGEGGEDERLEAQAKLLLQAKMQAQAEAQQLALARAHADREGRAIDKATAGLSGAEAVLQLVDWYNNRT